MNDGFTDFNSGRQNRIRYAPKYSGFTVSTSGSSDQRWGTALRWAGTGYGVKAAAGVGVQDPSKNGVDEVYSGSASVLHEATVLNLTLASALQDRGDLRGVDLIVAVTFVAEIGDLRRFESPRHLMAYLGLAPSKRSTDDTVRRGGIAKAGKVRVRHLLVESAWTYRHPPRIGAKLLRVMGHVPALRAIVRAAHGKRHSSSTPTIKSPQTRALSP